MIKYIKKKKEKGMEILIDSYRGIITSVVRKHLGVLVNYEEECVDDVLLSIWNNIKSFDSTKNSFKNWICAISKYKAIDYKKKYLLKVEYMDISEDIYYIDQELLKSEIEEEVNDILSHLNERDKQLFKQHYLNGETLEEIAIKNNTKVSNLYNRLSRGRKKIRENIIRQEGKIMKSEFEMLNDVKIDIDNYEEVEFENNDEIKNRMKSKIKSNNSNYKKIITASSLMAILCFGLI